MQIFISANLHEKLVIFCFINIGKQISRSFKFKIEQTNLKIFFILKTIDVPFFLKMLRIVPVRMLFL